MEDKNFDYLKVLTKAEIIEFFKQSYMLSAPTEHEVNFFKWETESNKISEEMDRHCKSNKSDILIEKINVLITKANAEKDLQKKIIVLDKLDKAQQELKAFHKEFDVLIERDKKNNKFLDKVKR